MPCPTFHASEASGFEEENFNIFLCIPGHPGDDPYWTQGPSFEQTLFRIRRKGYIPNFKQLSLAVLEKKIFKHILLANPESPGTILNKFGKGRLNNAIYQISSI